MCGIFGYIGPKNPVEVCLSGLKLLEYRGYDSAGIAGVHRQKLLALKEIGKLSNLEEAAKNLSFQLENAISHTRWATHGKPSKENAHPHFDQHHHVAVVHNGIIENHFALRAMLLEKGVSFHSDTDSEIIAQLTALHYEGDLVAAFQKTLSLLKGFWAIALIHKDHPGTILASCKENPLAIGLSSPRAEAFISSDVNAFHSPDLEILFLKNGELASISSTGIEIFDKDSLKISRQLERMSVQRQLISKNGFEHFMLKEIFEQPDVIRQALHGRVNEELGEVTFPGLALSKEELASIKKVLIVACGTSWHAALIAASWIEDKAGISAQAEIASEFRYRNSVLSENTLVVAISQSGETFDTIACVRELKERGAKVLAICNAKNSTLTRDADGCIFLEAGPEVSVCSTKAFTSQLTVLFLFTLLMARLRTMSAKEAKLHLEDLHSLPAKVDLVLRKKEALQALARKYASFNNFFFLGRGYMYAASLEGALKLKEISYIHAMGYPAGEMKHGPIALMDPTLATIALCGHKKTLDKMLSNLMEVQARGAPILAFATEGTPEINTIADDLFYLPETSDEMACIPYSVAAQLLAYYIALERGTDIDQPRNLAKSVTVE